MVIANGPGPTWGDERTHMIRFLVCLLVAHALGVPTGSAFAQVAPSFPTASSSSPMTPGANPTSTAEGADRPDAASKEDWQRLRRVSKILGSDVRNPRGDKMGEVKDLILDRNGNVSHAVVATGGFLGIGNRLHAVPWGLLQAPPGRGFRVLDIDKSRLKNAPNFDPENWPNVLDERWGEENNRHYQPSPAGR